MIASLIAEAKNKVNNTNCEAINESVNGKKKLIVDATSEAFFDCLPPEIQKALGTGGLGFLKGEEWKHAHAGNERIGEANVVGFMPGYANYIKNGGGNAEKIDWDQLYKDHAEYLFPLLDDNNERIKLNVLFNGRYFKTTFSVLNTGGAPVILVHSEVLNQIYSEPDNDEDYHKAQHFAFMARAYSALFGYLGTAPDLLRINEPQLALMFQEVENIKDGDVLAIESERSATGKVDEAVSITRSQIAEVFNKKEAKTLLTTHTPEVAALPFYVSKKWVELKLGKDIIPDTAYELFEADDPKVRAKCAEHDITGSGGNGGKIYAVNYMKVATRYADWINGVSREHGQEVTQLHLMETQPERDKTIYITNGSDPDLWAGEEVKTLIAEKKIMRDISGRDLFSAGQKAKKRLNNFLEANYKDSAEKAVRFTDPSKMTFGLVRRLVEYKMQGALIPLIEWICGEPDKQFENVPGFDAPVAGLGANLLIGGQARDELGEKWAVKLKELSERTDLKGKFIFIDDTGTEFMKAATEACDVWVQTPLESREACGTSYQRAKINGHIDLDSYVGGPIEHTVNGKDGYLVNVFRDNINDPILKTIFEATPTMDAIIATLNIEEENYWVDNKDLAIWQTPDDLVEVGQKEYPNGKVFRYRNKKKHQLFKFYESRLPVMVAPIMQQLSEKYKQTQMNDGETKWTEMQKESFVKGWTDINIQRMNAQYNTLYNAILEGDDLNAYQMQNRIDKAGHGYLFAQQKYDPLFAPSVAYHKLREEADKHHPWKTKDYGAQSVAI